MFNKIKCPRCNNKSSKGFDYCPFCAYPFSKRAKEEDFGMFGTGDIDEEELVSNSFFGGFTSGVMEKMLGSAMKMLEKEIAKEMNQQDKNKNKIPSPPQNRIRMPGMNTNFQLYINGKKVNLQNMNMSYPESPKATNKKVKIKLPNATEESMKKYKSLPREEAKTNVRRLSNKVVYEIDIPGVKSNEDISITQLESSIEIKAVSKDKSYFKIIPVSLPVSDFKLDDGKLVLELDAK